MFDLAVLAERSADDAVVPLAVFLDFKMQARRLLFLNGYYNTTYSMLCQVIKICCTGYIWKEKKAFKPNPDVSLRAFCYKKIRLNTSPEDLECF